MDTLLSIGRAAFAVNYRRDLARFEDFVTKMSPSPGSGLWGPLDLLALI